MEKKTIPTVKLSNGVDFPVIGFGVAALDKGEILDSAIQTALGEGYRFFDNAPFYGNEAEVGRAIRNSGYKREELFISTKLPNWCHAYDDAIAAFHESRERMGLEYLDMYLIHHPMPAIGKYCEAWKALEHLVQQGYLRVPGLSNFKEHHIERILDMCTIKPPVNELECNPYFTIKPLRDYCKKQDIRVLTWFPLGGPLNPPPPIPPRPEGFVNMLENETLLETGAKYNKTAAQIALRWAIDVGMTPIPKSGREKRIKENIDLFDFSLSEEDIARIEALDQDRRLGPDPDFYNDLSRDAMDV